MSRLRLFSGSRKEHKDKEKEKAEVVVPESPPEYQRYALDTEEPEEQDGLVFSAEEDETSTAAYCAESTPVACAASTPIPGNFADLKFDEHYHGKNVIVTEKGLQAERLKKGKEAVVMTNRPMNDSELLEIEIGNEMERFKGVKAMLSAKGSIRIGVTTHCPGDLWPTFPHSMKRMNSGTWMMKGDDILENGEVSLTYSRYNLKNLMVGDRLGVMRASEFGGSLIFFINGYSIGIVATGVPDNVYGFVELHGDCDTVTITPNSSVELGAFPAEIRAVRIREAMVQSEITSLTQQLQEKEALVNVLKGQIEELEKRRQPSPSTLRKTCETQTNEVNMLPDGSGSQEDTDAPSTKKKSPQSKKACCAIL